jgi:hypothetical protein
MHPNSSSQPTPRAGNLNGRRREIIPDSMGSSQPTPRLGNLSRRRRDVIPDSMGSNQTTSRGGNLNGRRRDVVLADRVSRSGTQQSESGSSNTAGSSGRNSSPPPIARRLLGRPAKRLRSSTIQTTAYTEPEMEPDGQGHMEPVRLSDDSCDEYQMSHLADETEPDTEPDIEDLGSADERTSRRRRGPRLAETHGNNRPRTVRISTNSGSQEAAIVPPTPAARVTITPGRAFSPATFPSSSVARYSSPLGVPSSTSGIRSSSPPAPVCVQQVSNSRRNTVTGVEGEILGVAKTLMLHYTLLVHPLPNPVALTSEVHSIWSRAQDEIADAGNIEPSPKSIKVVSQMAPNNGSCTNYERYVENTLQCGRSLCII